MAMLRLRKRKSYAGRRKTRRYTRRRYNAKKSMVRRPRNMSRLPGFPETYRTTLIYNEALTLDPDVGGTHYYSFNANNLYDPNYTGTGHQPLYYDNLTQIYERWRVRAAYITVTVVDSYVGTSTVDAGTGFRATGTTGRLVITRDINPGDQEGNINVLMEERSANLKWRYFSAMTTGRMPKLKMKMIPHVMLKMNKDDASLFGSTSSGPSANCYFNVGVAGIDDVINPFATRLNVRIAYICDFYDRKIDQAEN